MNKYIIESKNSIGDTIYVQTYVPSLSEKSYPKVTYTTKKYKAKIFNENEIKIIPSMIGTPVSVKM